MKRKALQKSSKYEQYDIDNDGIVSDEEFEHMAEIKRLEHDLRKQRAQRRMATASLVAMASFTVAMFFVDLERVKALSDISNLFYITGGGIVAAYMGASAIMNRKGSGRRLYTDENPKDTVKIKYATVADARATARKVKNINKPFARKIQILTVMEQRSKVAGKPQQAAIAKRAKEAIRRQKKTR